MPTSIPSNPASFTCSATGVPVALTFAVPSGTYISGYWLLSVVPVKSDLLLSTSPSNSQIDITVPDINTIALTSQQLADVNTAAGGNLSASISCPGGSMVQVTSLTLNLNTAPLTRRRGDMFQY